MDTNQDFNVLETVIKELVKNDKGENCINVARGAIQLNNEELNNELQNLANQLDQVVVSILSHEDINKLESLEENFSLYSFKVDKETNEIYYEYTCMLDVEEDLEKLMEEAAEAIALFIQLDTFCTDNNLTPEEVREMLDKEMEKHAHS